MTERESTSRVAVIGCGHWGKNLVRNFHRLGGLESIVEATPAGRKVAAELAPDAAIVEDFEVVLQSDVAGIVLATPAVTHFELACRALDAGKHLFVEKPLALTYDEGAELVRRAAAADRILMVGHVLEYHPGIRRLNDLIREGELGEIRYIYSNRLSLGKIRREENILWSFAPHDIAVILRLVGEMPVQVIACGGNYLQPGIADVTLTNLFFASGIQAHIHVSWLHPFKEQRLVVIGSRKMASFDDVAKELVLYDQRVDLTDGEPVPIRGEGRVVAYDVDEPLELECRAFLEAMRSGRPPLTDGVSGLRVLEVLQAAQFSLSGQGERIRLPLDVLVGQSSLIGS